MSTTWTAVKARTEHRCDEARPGCTGIHPGEVYRRDVWFPDSRYGPDDVAVVRTCAHCMAAREREF